MARVQEAATLDSQNHDNDIIRSFAVSLLNKVCRALSGRDSIEKNLKAGTIRE
jgi:hypothetical protein